MVCVSSHLISMVTFARSWHILAVSVLRSRLHAMRRACPTLVRPPFLPPRASVCVRAKSQNFQGPHPVRTSHVFVGRIGGAGECFFFWLYVSPRRIGVRRILDPFWQRFLSRLDSMVHLHGTQLRPLVNNVALYGF